MHSPAHHGSVAVHQLRPRRVATAAYTALVIAITYFVYREAVFSYFTEDDFGWLTSEASFHFEKLRHLGNYHHFYRPIVELYFAAGYRLFGCDPLRFHLASLTIHLATVLVLYQFAYALTAKRAFGATAAVLFASMPGHVEAVAWVAAITDLLPAFLYISTLWLYLRFLQTGKITLYLFALTTFAAALLTHESAATLLPLMVLVHLVAGAPRDRAAVKRLVPFAALLSVFLIVAFIVNSRSYLISEGHYRFGWHAIPNVIQYILSLYVGIRNLPSYAAIVAVVIVLLARGTPRVRLFVLWILITVLPASFFTWGNVSRYLYLPAAGFALLLAEAVLAVHRWSERRLGSGSAAAIAGLLVAALTVRFMLFARKESERFRDRTVPYARYVAAVRSASPVPPPDGIVRLGPDTLQHVPEPFRDQAAEVAYCMAPVHVVAR